MDIVKDLFLTDCFLIKCFVETGGMRLSDFLARLSRPYVLLRDATLIDVEKGESVSSPEVLLGRDEVILAHELLDVSGDETLKRVFDARRFSLPVDLYHTGGVGIEIGARMQPKAFRGLDRESDFFVVLDASVHESFGLLSSLPWAVVNRKQIGYILNRNA